MKQLKGTKKLEWDEKEHKPVPFVEYCNPPPCGNLFPCTKICRYCEEAVEYPDLDKGLLAQNIECKQISKNVNATLFGKGKCYIFRIISTIRIIFIYRFA